MFNNPIFRKLTYLFVTLVILVISPLVSGRTEWLDPHSLDDDPRIECSCPSTSIQLSDAPNPAVASYYIRAMNILIKSLNYNKEVYSGRYEVALDIEDYDFMQQFVDQLQDASIHSSIKDLERMDKLVAKIFTNKESLYMLELIGWRDYIHINLMSREFGVAMGCIFAFWFLYKLKHAKFQYWLMFKYFVFVLFVVDFVYTWIYMLKEKELEQMLHAKYTAPPDCNLAKMSYSQYISNLWTTRLWGVDKCAEYHKIQDIDIFWAVSPSQVFGVQIGNLIVAPAEKIGNAFSLLVRGVLKDASWFMIVPTVAMMPILLFGFIVGGCIILSFLTGRGFSFNILHLLQFSFGGGSSDNSSNQRQQMPAVNLTLPQIQLGVRDGPRMKRSKNTGKKKTPLTAIEGPQKVEIEDVPEDSGHNDGSIPDGESACLKKCADYEVMA